MGREEGWSEGVIGGGGVERERREGWGGEGVG